MAGSTPRTRKIASASHALRPDWLRNADKNRNPNQWEAEYQVSVFLGREERAIGTGSLVRDIPKGTDEHGLCPSERLTVNESIKAIKEALNRHREMFDMTSLLDSRDSLATTIEDEIVRLARRLTPRTCAALMDEVYLVDRRPWSRLTDEEKVCLVTGTLELHTCPAWAFTVHLAHEKGRLINEGKTPFDDHHAAFRDSLRRALPADIRDEAIIVSAMEVSDAAARRDPTRPIGLHFHGLVALPARAKADQEDLKPQIRRALWIASGHQKHARHPPMMQLEPWDHPRPMGWALYTTKGTKRPDSKLVGKDLVKFSHSAVRRGRAFHETVVQSWARALRRASFELERYTRTQEALGVIELSQLDRAA